MGFSGRRPMRSERNKFRRTMLGPAVFAITVGILVLFSPQGMKQPRASESLGVPQLVSIEPVADLGEMCLGELIDVHAAPPENNLFASLEQTSVHAAWQQNGQTADVTRPPVRNILDTDPIYTSVGVDTRNDEVFLQDSNTWSIRVFIRLANTPPIAARTRLKAGYSSR